MAVTRPGVDRPNGSGGEVAYRLLGLFQPGPVGLGRLRAFFAAEASPRASAFDAFASSSSIWLRSFAAVSSARARASGSVRFHSACSTELSERSIAFTRWSSGRIASRGTLPISDQRSRNSRKAARDPLRSSSGRTFGS